MIAIVAGTPLGAALATRLRSDGREVIAIEPGQSLEPLRALRLVVVDAPAADLLRLARALGDVLDGNHLVAHTIRGLTADGTGATQILHQETAVRRLGVIAGPLAAADLQAGRPSAGVIASRHPEVVEELSAAMSTPRLRLYRGHDPLGVELASSLTDLVTVGCGLAHALGFGETSRALMIVRAVRELGRLIVALGGEVQTASGLAGLGDILVRSHDPESHFFRLGVELAGGSVSARAELVGNARTFRALGRHHRVPAHIFDGLAQLLEGKLAPAELVTHLMTVPILDD